MRGPAVEWAPDAFWELDGASSGAAIQQAVNCTGKTSVLRLHLHLKFSFPSSSLPGGHGPSQGYG